MHVSAFVCSRFLTNPHASSSYLYFIPRWFIPPCRLSTQETYPALDEHMQGKEQVQHLRPFRWLMRPWDMGSRFLWECRKVRRREEWVGGWGGIEDEHTTHWETEVCARGHSHTAKTLRACGNISTSRRQWGLMKGRYRQANRKIRVSCLGARAQRLWLAFIDVRNQLKQPSPGINPNC